MPDTIIYKSYGKGKKIILLHGFCESGEIWNKIIPALSEQFHLLIPDLPGFGLSPLPKEPITIESVAEKINGWIKSITNEKVVVIGHSMGGYITLALADNHPEQLQSLGLINSTAYPDDELKKEKRLKTVEFIEKNGKNKFLDSFIPGLFFDKNPSSKQLIKETRKILERASEEAMTAYTLAMRQRPSRINILKESPLPILFIAGEHDQIVSEEKSAEQINLIKNHHTHLIKDCAHMCMLEKPEETVQHMLGFTSPL